MKKVIVTTTVNGKTDALDKFSSQPGWELVVVGDIKTPAFEFSGSWCIYLDCDTQKRFVPQLSKLLGWNTIQRRNIGFLYAYSMGADLIATVDDDNVPEEGWHKYCCDCLVENKDIDIFKSDSVCIDPLLIASNGDFWHRGFPLELTDKHNNTEQPRLFKGKSSESLVQTGFWYGDPDIDAIQRIGNRHKQINYNYDRVKTPFSIDSYSPFNSQNTVFKREALPYYCCLPEVGRMDDIWGGYILQNILGKNIIIYSDITVTQNRNRQDLLKNLEAEWLGYKHTYQFLNDNCNMYASYIPYKARVFYEEYRKAYDNLAQA